MKKIPIIKLALFISIGVLSCQTSNSQTLKDKSISERYYQYPSNPLPSYANTYYTVAEGYGEREKRINYALNNKANAFYFKIDGYTHVFDEKEADVEVEINVKNIKILSKRSEDTTRIENEKKINEHFYRIVYKLDYEFVVKSRKFKGVIYREHVNKKDIYETSPIPIADDLNKTISESEIEENLDRLLPVDLYRKLILYWGKKTYAQFRISLYTAKGKLNYDDLDQAFKQFKSIMKDDIAGSLNDEQRKKMESCVAVWEKALLETDTVNPKARINKDIYYGLNYDLSAGYCWLGNLNKANNCFNIASAYTTDKDYKENLRQLKKWLFDYEKNYIINHMEFNISDLLIGKWKLTKYTSSDQIDLNKDGRSSNDVMAELDSCKMRIQLEITSDNFNFIVGNVPSCEVKKSLNYYKVRNNLIDERKYLIWDSHQPVDQSTGSTFKIVSIDPKTLVIHGDTYLTGDTSSDVEMTFTKE
jgi:hypothetical protein